MPNHDHSELTGARVKLRPPVESDLGHLVEILRTAEVSTWWGRWDEEKVRREILDPEDESIPYVVEMEGAVAGYIQYGEDNDPEYKQASIDIFLDPRWHGKGLGQDAIQTLAGYLFRERGHHRITIDPAAHNAKAIRSYERVGFRPIGIMRQYERGADGSWHDGLLMDLLKDEFSSGEQA